MAQDTERREGVVKRLINDKGFGFVRDGGGVEYFFHRSAARDFDTMIEGTRVTFRIGTGNKGPRAEEVETV